MSNRRATILAVLMMVFCFGIAGAMDYVDEQVKYGVSDEH